MEERPADKLYDTAEEMFHRGEEYDAMLHLGLRFTGERKEHFLEGRLELLRELLPPGFEAARILDFGCGTGDTSVALAARFPEAKVTGTDTAPQLIEYARRNRAEERVDFLPVSGLGEEACFDLCYVNGVFHHVHPEQRDQALVQIRRVLAPGGYFALFENNPWNPGTRLVMKKIPFDRDAIPINPPQARALLKKNGFLIEGPTRFLFFFPAFLRWLRPLEPYLRSVPLGGQYVILGRVESEKVREKASA